MDSFIFVTLSLTVTSYLPDIQVVHFETTPLRPPDMREPRLAKILGRAYDEQLEGSITDRKKALEYAGHLAAELGALPPEGAK